MLGRSSNSTINSLVIGMAGPHVPALGEDRAPSRLGSAGHEILRPRNLMFKMTWRGRRGRRGMVKCEESRSQVAHQRVSAAPHHKNLGHAGRRVLFSAWVA